VQTGFLSRLQGVATRQKGTQARKVTIGVEADRLEFETWNRAAALRRAPMESWIKKALNEAAEADKTRGCPRPIQS
jgi:hypothetical protein